MWQVRVRKQEVTTMTLQACDFRFRSMSPLVKLARGIWFESSRENGAFRTKERWLEKDKD